MAYIEAVGAREILDSRGNPTVEVEVALERRHGVAGGGTVRRLDRAVRGGRASRRRCPGTAAKASARPSPRSTT